MDGFVYYNRISSERISVKSLLTVRVISYSYMFWCHYDCDWWSGQLQKWPYRILQFLHLSIHCNLNLYLHVSVISGFRRVWRSSLFWDVTQRRLDCFTLGHGAEKLSPNIDS